MKLKLPALLSVAALAFGSVFSAISVLAQVTTDGTTSTTVTNTDAGVQIDRGNRSGGNLFHSFDEFSVPTNTEAFFNNADDIANIFSRVTGGNISNIDGVLRANGAANLFLINPAGIVFGNNARLQLGGSFYGSTADSIIFPDGEFNATDLENPPLITVNAPIGLGFRDNPAEIVNQSTADDLGLQVSSGNTFALVGGDIRFTGGLINALGADIELGGLTEAGIVAINEDGSLSFSDELAKANVILDVFLERASVVNVISDGGGSITINANNFELLNGSRLLAGILEGTVSPEAQAGDIVINATEKVTIDSQDTDFFTSIQNVAGNVSEDFAIDIFTKGNPGNIIINTEIFEGKGNFAISSINNGEGTVGNIDITATESALFIGEESFTSSLNSIVSFFGIGDGGDITISTPSLIVSDVNISTSTFGAKNSGDIVFNITESLSFGDRSQLQTDSFSGGDAGNITINAESADVSMAGEGSLLTTSVASIESLTAEFPEFIELLAIFGISPVLGSQGGDIIINARNLTVDNGVNIRAFTSGKASSERLANAGNIEINVVENAVFTNNVLLATATLGQGNAGNIELNAGSNVSLENDSNLSSSVFDEIISTEEFEQLRQGGDIIISANSLFLTEGSTIFASTLSLGNAGNIELNINENLNLSNSSRLNSDTTGGGNAGDIIINVDRTIALNKASSINTRVLASSDNSTVDFEGSVEGGNIIVDAKNVNLTNGSQIAASTSGDGNAGFLSINASESVIISGTNAESRGGLFANALVGDGKGGDIVVSTNQLSLLDGAIITASNFSNRGFTEAGTGEAGNVTITANSFTLSNEARIDTATRSGNGGSATFEIADTLTLRDNSFISARALNNASGGNIAIDADFIVAFPSRFDGNDIRADAEQGKGGRIDITAESVLGIAERTLNPLTNDLNASSDVAGLAGNVSINTPDINPLRTESELPTNLVTNNIVATNACSVSNITERSNLVVKGKGSIAPQMTNPLTLDSLIIDSQEIALDSFKTKNETTIANPISSEIHPVIATQEKGTLYAARGMVRQEDGTVYLTAYSTSGNQRAIAINSENCGYN